MKKYKIVLVCLKFSIKVDCVFSTAVRPFVRLFSDKKLEDSFQKSMDAGMLRYIQPKGANEIKVSYQFCKNILYTDFSVPSSPIVMIYSKL